MVTQSVLYQSRLPGANLGGIEHFISKHAFDITGLGRTWLNTLYANQLIQTPADIFTLTYDDLIALPRMGDKSVNNLLTEINTSKTINLNVSYMLWASLK